MSDSAALPQLGGVLETALYVDDLNRSSDFFAGVLGLVAIFRSDRLVAFDAGGNTVLLFARGASRDDMTSAGGTIPGHDGAGPLHMAFAIAVDTYSDWRTRLLDQGVPIRSESAMVRRRTQPLFPGSRRTRSGTCDAGPVEELLTAQQVLHLRPMSGPHAGR